MCAWYKNKCIALISSPATAAATIIARHHNYIHKQICICLCIYTYTSNNTQHSDSLCSLQHRHQHSKQLPSKLSATFTSTASFITKLQTSKQQTAIITTANVTSIIINTIPVEIASYVNVRQQRRFDDPHLHLRIKIKSFRIANVVPVKIIMVYSHCLTFIHPSHSPCTEDSSNNNLQAVQIYNRKSSTTIRMRDKKWN